MKKKEKRGIICGEKMNTLAFIIHGGRLLEQSHLYPTGLVIFTGKGESV